MAERAGKEDSVKNRGYKEKNGRYVELKNRQDGTGRDDKLDACKEEMLKLVVPLASV